MLMNAFASKGKPFNAVVRGSSFVRLQSLQTGSPGLTASIMGHPTTLAVGEPMEEGCCAHLLRFPSSFSGSRWQFFGHEVEDVARLRVQAFTMQRHHSIQLHCSEKFLEEFLLLSRTSRRGDGGGKCSDTNMTPMWLL